jgi:hypothetical protein
LMHQQQMEEMATFVDFLKDEPEGLAQVEDHEEAEAIVRQFARHTRPETVVDRIRFSQYPNRLLRVLAEKYRGKTRWQEFLRAVIAIPATMWCRRSGIECFCIDSARTTFKGDAELGELIMSEAEIRENPDHPLWLIADADAYWTKIVMASMTSGKYVRAYDEIKRVARGIRVPSLPKEKDPEKTRLALALWKGTFHLRAPHQTAERLIKQLHDRLRAHANVPVVYENDEAIVCEPATPGYEFAKHWSHGLMANGSEVFSPAGRRVLHIARYCCDLRNAKRLMRMVN